MIGFRNLLSLLPCNNTPSCVFHTRSCTNWREIYASIDWLLDRLSILMMHEWRHPVHEVIHNGVVSARYLPVGLWAEHYTQHLQSENESHLTAWLCPLWWYPARAVECSAHPHVSCQISEERYLPVCERELTFMCLTCESNPQNWFQLHVFLFQEHS